MQEAERKFNMELEQLRQKVEDVRGELARKDVELVKMMEINDLQQIEINQEKNKNIFLNSEIEKIVDHFNRTGKLPNEYMGEFYERERLEKEQAEEEARIREEQEKLLADQKASAAKAQKELFKDIEGPKIARRKIILPKRDFTENDKKCRQMTMEELIKIMDDPNADESLRFAALRALVDIYGVELIEDELGNKILCDKDGNPLLTANGRPIKITDEFLKDLGAKLGQLVKIDMDLDQLKILEKMVAKGLSEEEAKKAVIADEMYDKLGDFLANCDVSIDSEEGPLPGTRNKGLCTIKIPLELQDAA